MDADFTIAPVTVAKDGTGQFTAIGEAVSYAQGKGIPTVTVLSGTYPAFTIKSTPSVAIVAQASSKNDFTKNQVTVASDGTALTVNADVAGLTIENVNFLNSGTSKSAVSLQGNKIGFYQCQFISSGGPAIRGNQAQAVIANSYIEAPTDLIDGASDIYIFNTVIVPTTSSSTVVYIEGSMPDGGATVVVDRSKIISKPGNSIIDVYLAAANEPGAQILYRDSSLGALITPTGVKVDPKTQNGNEYDEYQNTGPGAYSNNAAARSPYVTEIGSGNLEPFSIGAVTGPDTSWIDPAILAAIESADVSSTSSGPGGGRSSGNDGSGSTGSGSSGSDSGGTGTSSSAGDPDSSDSGTGGTSSDSSGSGSGSGSVDQVQALVAQGLVAQDQEPLALAQVLAQETQGLVAQAQEPLVALAQGLAQETQGLVALALEAQDQVPAQGLGPGRMVPATVDQVQALAAQVQGAQDLDQAQEVRVQETQVRTQVLTPLGSSTSSGGSGDGSTGSSSGSNSGTGADGSSVNGDGTGSSSGNDADSSANPNGSDPAPESSGGNGSDPSTPGSVVLSGTSITTITGSPTTSIITPTITIEIAPDALTVASTTTAVIAATSTVTGGPATTIIVIDIDNLSIGGTQTTTVYVTVTRTIAETTITSTKTITKTNVQAPLIAASEPDLAITTMIGNGTFIQTLMPTTVLATITSTSTDFTTTTLSCTPRQQKRGLLPPRSVRQRQNASNRSTMTKYVATSTVSVPGPIETVTRPVTKTRTVDAKTATMLVTTTMTSVVYTTVPDGTVTITSTRTAGPSENVRAAEKSAADLAPGSIKTATQTVEVTAAPSTSTATVTEMVTVDTDFSTSMVTNEMVTLTKTPSVTVTSQQTIKSTRLVSVVSTVIVTQTADNASVCPT
ncbi:putative pectin methylesterase [Penicillium oxalicum 114-2]|uniref:Putative pectin methylesterase n=1 Tax=Penicillium oxalicum (strain 114-2 / CGMCC 5302) TaxID=933388 RepID=S8B4W7_PENO1|nr:putative pectin methylesterase [Penicillium oxalicum 114-2]